MNNHFSNHNPRNLKYIHLLLLTIGIFIGCEKNEFSSTEILNQKSESPIINPDISVEVLSGFDIPEVLDEVQLKTGLSSTHDKTNKIVAKNFIINTHDVKKTIPKNGLSTYSFDMEVNGAELNHIYNLLVKADGKKVMDMSVIKFEIDPSSMEAFLTSNDDLSLINGSFYTYNYDTFLKSDTPNAIGKNYDCDEPGVPMNGPGGGSGITDPGESFTISANGLNVTADFSHQSLSPNHSYAFTLSVLSNGVVHTGTTNASSTDVSVFGYNGNLSSTWTSPIGINSVNVAVAQGDPCVITMEYEPVSSGDGKTTFVLVRNMDCGNSRKSSISSGKSGDCIYTSDGFSINTASKAIRKLNYYLPNMLAEDQLRLLEKHRSTAQLFVDYFLLNGFDEDSQNQVLLDIIEWINELPFDDRIINELGPKAKCVYDKLMAATLNYGDGYTSSITHSVLSNFLFPSWNQKVLTMQEKSSLINHNNGYALSNNVKAHLHNPSGSSDYQIHIRSSFINEANEVEIAWLLLHEMVHANLSVLYNDHGENSFFELFNEYSNENYGGDLQHQIMSYEYSTVIAEALAAFDNNRESLEIYYNLSQNGIPDQYRDPNVTIKMMSAARNKLRERSSSGSSCE